MQSPKISGNVLEKKIKNKNKKQTATIEALKNSITQFLYICSIRMNVNK